MVKTKICGITNIKDALTAVQLGVDALGFVFYPRSPRYISPEDAANIIQELPSFTSTVGLFVDAEQKIIDATLAKCPLDILQLHGQESASFCLQQQRRVIKAIAIRQPDDLKKITDYTCDILLDAPAPDGVHGGTGQRFNWQLLRHLKTTQTLILAGGLNTNNLQEALQIRQWYAVDVSSGVEIQKGIKSTDKMARFIECVRRFSS